MSTRGTHLALAVAVVIAFLLPKRVECGYPGATCGHAGTWRTTCTDVESEVESEIEIEPLGFYVIELVARRDVGFAYSAGDDCR